MDFSKCYQFFELELDNNHRKGWHYPRDNCRMDLWEFSWVVATALLCIPLALLTLISAVCIGLIIELSAMSPKRFDSTLGDCFKQVPNFITNSKHLLRLMDTLIFISILFPHQVEAAVAYLNVTALLSRIRKLNERLQEDLDTCLYLNRSTESNAARAAASKDPDSKSSAEFVPKITIDSIAKQGTSISNAQKNALNRRLETNMLLAKTVNDEFKMLKKSTTTYLDLLLIAGGFCLAIQGSVLFSSESKVVQVVVAYCIFAAIFPLVMCSIFCMAVEIRVSMSSLNGRMT